MAIAKNTEIEEFLCQEIHDNASLPESLGRLTTLF
jgi:flagellum-specific ATP synthase